MLTSHYSLLIFLAINYLSFTNCARILAISATNLHSHFTVFSGLISHLAPSHNITLYAQSPLDYKPPPNVFLRNFTVSTNLSFIPYLEIIGQQKDCTTSLYDVYGTYLLKSDDAYFDVNLMSSGVSELFDKKGSFDLLILLGYISEYFYYLAHILDVPIVEVVPSILLPSNSDTAGNPYSSMNDFNSCSYDSTATFWGRLRNFVKSNLMRYYYYGTYIPKVDKAAKKYYPAGIPSWQEVRKRTELIFVNTDNLIGYSRPNIPTVIEIGGIHIKPPKSIPQDLEDFISGAGAHGFIYFSLGTSVPESFLTEDFKTSISFVFSKLKQRVLWKWQGEPPNVSSNVKISKWFPQTDLLGHKNIKLFITHGGMLTTQEAVYHGVPVLIMPIFFDQKINAFLAEEKGFGKSLTFCQFTEQKFENYVRTIMNDSSYYQNMKLMSRAVRYRNQNLGEKVNWWINFAVNYKGTKLLKPVFPYQMWLQYDLLLFFSLILIIPLYLLFLMLVYVVKRFIVVMILNKKKND